MIDPDHTDSLLKKTAGGAGWTISWRAVTRTLGFLSTLVLARVLVPADFGLVALAISFASAIDIFGEIGVKDALVRATSSNRDAYDAAFTVNVIRGVITTALVAASAGPFARFFGDPRLYYVVLVLATTILLDALENIGVADFRRHLDFHREFQLNIFPRIAQVAITVTLALAFANYWALVAGLVTARALQTIISYVMHPYRPRISLRAWRDIAGFSVWTWLLSMARMIRDRCVIMIIGGMLNPAALGVFSIGQEVATLPETEFIGPLGRACFAGFAAARRVGLSVPEAYLRIVSSTSIIAIPASIGISSLAAPLVYVAFGAKWIEAVPVVEILAATGALAVLSRISTTLFNAFAYLGSLFWTAVFISVAQIALLVPFVSYQGIVGAAIALAIAALIEQSILSVLVFRRLAMRPWNLLSRVWRCLVTSAVMAVLLALSGLGWSANATTISANVWQLFVASLFGAAVYMIALLGLWVVSGRPNGPEVDLLSIVRGGSTGLYGSFRRWTVLLRTTASR
ncbi:MAG TPA: oligosaccharide flippase family protein [Acetobacteraceae bacterium]